MMETPVGGTEPNGRSTVELQRRLPPRLHLMKVRTMVFGWVASDKTHSKPFELPIPENGYSDIPSEHTRKQLCQGIPKDFD